MDAFVTSLNNPAKKMEIAGGHYSQAGDIHLHMPEMGFFSIHLTAAGIGTGNYKYTCPLYKAAQDVMWFFVKNEQSLLETEAVKKGLLSLESADIITFSMPDGHPGFHIALDFIRSKDGFFGVSGRMQHEKQNEENIVWLCGPENVDYAKFFGKQAYQKRRELFGHLYDMADAEPIKMANPIFPGEHGMKCITKGRKNDLH